MSHENIIRAWKDTEFRNNLSDNVRALLPENPAGLVQLTDAELGAAGGGLYAPTKAATVCAGLYAPTNAATVC